MAESPGPENNGARRRGRPGYDLATLLPVAVELFNERGYDGTSMRDLAARLGIAKSAIYHHVAGKEELLSLALDRALGGLSVVVSRARALPAPAIERLEYLVRGSVEVLQAESPYVTLLLRVRGNTDVERAALEQRRAFDRFVAELVAEAVRVLTAIENVELPLKLTNLKKAERMEHAATALKLVGLGDRLQHFPRQLSGGQEQRVAIARAIVTDPSLILADEPTGNLDAASALEVLTILSKLNKDFGKTVVMVTHDPHAAQFATHVHHLEKGALAAA